jgi:succinate dehydrogenase/fumarate reductase flavoprotein subunit
MQSENKAASSQMTRRSFIMTGATAIAAAGITAVEVAHASESAGADASDTAESSASSDAAANAGGSNLTSATMEVTPGLEDNPAANATAGASHWFKKADPVDDADIADTFTADVVILGAGHAGTCAARAAAEQGASVQVIEMQYEEAFTVNGNELGSINNKLATERGVENYNPEDFLREVERRTIGRCNSDVIRAFAQRSGEHVDWFMEPLSDEFLSHVDTFCAEYPKNYPGENQGIHVFLGCNSFFGGEEWSMTKAILANQELAKQAGAEFHFGMVAEQPVMEDGACKGLIAYDRDTNEHYKFLANKGVILCGGDWSGNDEMVKYLLPEYVEFNQGKQAKGCGRDGSGCMIGIMAGGHIEEGPRAATYSMQAGMAGPLGATAFLRVNELGKRYCNEGMYGAWGQGEAAARTTGNLLCAVWDANWQDELTYQPPDHFNVDPNWSSFEGLRDAMDALEPGPDGGMVPCQVWTPAGYPEYKVVCANTLDELADYIGFTGEAKQSFLETVETYNQYCEDGDDPDYAKEAFLLHPVKEPPFYAYFSGKYFGDLVVTLSGLRIDANQQVLDSNYEPIPGLYACGNNSGGRFVLNYSTTVTGMSLGIAQLQGQVAGEYVANL